MIGLKSKKKELAKVPASDNKIEETKARVDEIYWLMISLKLRLLKIEAMIEQLHDDHKFERLMELLRDTSQKGGDSKMATAEKLEVDYDQMLKEFDEKYPTNYESFVTYGSYEDLQDMADNNESSDLSEILLR